MIRILARLLPFSIRTRLDGNAGLASTLDNILWLILDYTLRLVVSFFVLAWLARHLGPGDFGIYSYAAAFTALLGAVAALGLKDIVVRDLVRHPDRQGEIMGTACALRLVGGLLAVGTAAVLINILKPGADDGTVRAMTMIFSLEFIFRPLDVMELWFLSRSRSRNTVLARNAISVLTNIVRITMIVQDAPLIAFAWVTFLGVATEQLGIVIAYRLAGNSPARWTLRLPTARRLLADSWPLIFFGLAIALYRRIDQVMIGQMLDSASVGIYSASVRLSSLWYFIPSAIVPSVFPAIVRAKGIGDTLYQARLQTLYDLLALVSIGIAVPITLLATPLVHLIYGEQYAAAAPVLRIHVWAGLLASLAAASQRFLMAENLTRLTFLRTALGCATNVVLNAILIPTMGITGAALATLASFTASTFAIAIHPAGRGQAVMMFRSVFLLGILRHAMKLRFNRQQGGR